MNDVEHDKKRNRIALLMSDALDRVIHNPAASYCWLNLVSVTDAWVRRGYDSGQLRQWLDRLRAAVPANDIAGFHWAMYQHYVTQEPGFLKSASALLLTIVPADLDRMAAFFNFAWQITLARSSQRAVFVSALQEIGLPLLTQCMGQMVARQARCLPPVRPIERIQKVAIVAAFLFSKDSPPTMMALEQAQLARQNGMQVGLFSCQEAQVPDYANLLGNGFGVNQDSYQIDTLIRELGLELTVAVNEPRFSLMRRALDMLEKISAFDPDLVLVVGLHSCLAQALYAVRPVLALGVNSIASMLPADVWLAARADAGNHPWGARMPASQPWHHPWRLSRKSLLANLSRAELGLPEDALVLISSAWCLPITVAPEWLDAMAAFLRQHPQVVWVLLRSDDGLAASLQHLPDGQLHLLPGTDNVMGVLACCDIYVNPPRMGGGFAVADAMAAGLPALCFADSDGGDKLGSAGPLAHDLGDYFSLLQQWVRDPALRLELGARMRQQFDQQLDLAHAGPSVLGAGQAALSRFQARTGAAVEA